ncbi:hypothetical protein [Agrobacterium sp. SORGH_AS 787]|nr:hypothetical protein [Rhizobium sp. SORGH_AS_0787]
MTQSDASPLPLYRWTKSRELYRLTKIGRMVPLVDDSRYDDLTGGTTE